MIAAFDNTFLTLILKPDSPPCPDPATGRPAPHCRHRIEALIDSLSKRDSTQVLVPAPSLAESLVASGDVEKVVAAISRFTAIQIVPFDARSAIEFAIMTRAAIENGDKRAGVDLDWQRVKFDRQIVAIAKAHGASTLYTDDGPQTAFAELGGMTVKHTWDLELPGEYAQKDMWEDDRTR